MGNKTYKYNKSQYIDIINTSKGDYQACKELSSYCNNQKLQHYQLCCEKLLKGILIFNEQEIEHTHDLKSLYEKCEKYGLNLSSQERELLFELNGYEANNRYFSYRIFDEEDIKNALTITDIMINKTEEILDINYFSGLDLDATLNDVNELLKDNLDNDLTGGQSCISKDNTSKEL